MTDNLFLKIQKDLEDALRQKDEVKTSTLRLAIAAVNNAKIEKGRELEGQELVGIIQKEAKKRQESIAAFKSGGRHDLAEKEEKELAILKTYLPEPISDEELLKIVDSQISEVGARDIKDLGKVMSAVLSKVKGRADGGTVAAVVKSKLSS
ncbi:glutamyl-tRNA amidotransferase [Candidatus Curtissbacteria bacterium RIFCSPHIGHO2_12_41_11]|uniref:Glutamyl-tRNA amidotransferase n=1 Tax=Candidatus Curtissbacteria bacterium RIFCSPHIGHO2_12_41_11 TaxID=1797718 RepID=A0A1F5H4Q8_9BACT|nr:MAG: glutamyl-tRNA amidotransferase [Candidatus Curtissbacteria bacterium RIFCSPHIGHO2_12_41_11]